MSKSWNLGSDHRVRYFPYAELEDTLKEVRKFCRKALFVNSVDLNSSYFSGTEDDPDDRPGVYWSATVVYTGIKEN